MEFAAFTHHTSTFDLGFDCFGSTSDFPIQEPPFNDNTCYNNNNNEYTQFEQYSSLAHFNIPADPQWFNETLNVIEAQANSNDLGLSPGLNFTNWNVLNDDAAMAPAIGCSQPSPLPYGYPEIPVSFPDFGTSKHYEPWLSPSYASTPPLSMSETSSPSSHASPYERTDVDYANLSFTPAPLDPQDFLDFLNNTADHSNSSSSACGASKRSHRSRASRPLPTRIQCPNYHLCGKTFCRSEALNRHLKRSCGMQCDACIASGQVAPGMSCAHHRGAGRPVGVRNGEKERAGPYRKR